MKQWLRTGLAEALYFTNLGSVLQKGKVAILTYHRVVAQCKADDDWIQPGMYVTPDVFERHMRFLRERFQVLSLQELVERWNKHDWNSNACYCAVTFDDGWLDNYRYAFPILRKFDLPATIFLPTDFVGTDEWFWPEKVTHCMKKLLSGEDECLIGAAILKQYLGVGPQDTRLAYRSEVTAREFADRVIERCKSLDLRMIAEMIDQFHRRLAISPPRERCIVSWDEVADMAEHRISFGSHSRSHRILTQLRLEEVKQELEGSQQVVKARSGNFVPVFCYPNGNTNSQIQDLAKECGYLAAVGVRPGLEGKRPIQLFDLRRIGIHNDITSTVPLYSMRLYSSSIA